MRSSVALLMGMFAGMRSMLPEGDPPVKITSYKIEARKEEQQLSKRKLQLTKGKEARKNRGNNR